MDLLERFSRFIDTSTDCWNWTGAVDKDGYGKIWMGETVRTARAPRVAYELYVGPIPDGLQIDHLCRNHACVRPDHLETVTGEENYLRGNRSGNTIKTKCVRGHEFNAKNTRYEAGHRACRVCKRDRARERRAMGLSA